MVGEPWSSSRVLSLVLAGLASAASVPFVVVAVSTLLVVASAVDGWDSYAALGVILLAGETFRGIGNVAWPVIGMSFVLFPIVAVLTRDRPWFRSTILPCIGATVGAVIASGQAYTSATNLGAVAGLIAGFAFAFVVRGDGE
ncbi:hypothetical protein [Methylorubrum podarium]|jgi:hypothetical protein|uniref:hypothetical protein n=1 Tax=Methylorubrum podarium TaxID=200476 RepID=UPI001EE32C42|nr:hypothetical protein [Methylorubrum podarium]